MEELQKFLNRFTKVHNLHFRYIIQEDIKTLNSFGGLADYTVTLYRVYSSSKKEMVCQHTIKGKTSEVKDEGKYLLLESLILHNDLNYGME